MSKLPHRNKRIIRFRIKTYCNALQCKTTLNKLKEVDIGNGIDKFFLSSLMAIT